MQRLLDWFKDKDGAVVAFSGGVDSSVVARAAREVLGERAIAVTSISSTFPVSEAESAKRVASEIGIRLEIIHEDELENPKFVENSPDRCYYCRQGLIGGVKKVAKKHSISLIVDGANADDAKEHRPGLRAMREAGVRSPLLELGLGKKDVREIAKRFGLSVNDKPSMACLASRIPYGERITIPALRRVESAEAFLKTLGVGQLRVRHHDGTARIEVLKDDMPKILKNKKTIVEKLTELGFSYVTLDLDGYRSGSMDEVLK